MYLKSYEFFFVPTCNPTKYMLTCRNHLHVHGCMNRYKFIGVWVRNEIKWCMLHSNSQYIQGTNVKNMYFLLRQSSFSQKEILFLSCVITIFVKQFVANLLCVFKILDYLYYCHFSLPYSDSIFCIKPQHCKYHEMVDRHIHWQMKYEYYMYVYASCGRRKIKAIKLFKQC